MKSLIMLQASAEQPLNGQLIPHDTLLGVLLFIHAEIKVNPC